MAHATKQLGQDPQYELFLYAAMGEDRRGASVTVLSMLARLGVDPWGEAMDLASLPEGAAQERLASLMARFHDVQTRDPDRSATVSTLLAFLPQQTRSAIPSSQGVPTGLTSPPLGSPFFWIVAATVFLGWVAMLAQGQ